MKRIVTRAEALADNLARFFTGRACSKGHIAERYTNNWKCCECGRLATEAATRRAREAARAAA